LTELGVDAVIESPYGIAAPAGLAPARLRIIHDAFKAALESAQGRKILEQLNQPLNYRSPQEFEQYARSAYAREKTRMERFKAVAGGTPSDFGRFIGNTLPRRQTCIKPDAQRWA
jgi:tripartite-type tricarboxylate transporter receptor subunit TctC